MTLNSMYVSPHMRRQGLGWKLMEKVTRFARAGGCSHVELLTSEIFEKAVPMYIKYGYKITSRDPFPWKYMAPVTHNLLMERKV